METDLFMTLFTKFGPFVAMVIFVMWENKQREAKYQERENTFIEETRKREAKYIEREDKYIEIIESFSENFKDIQENFKDIQKDVSGIKEKLERL